MVSRKEYPRRDEKRIFSRFVLAWVVLRVHKGNRETTYSTAIEEV